MHKISKKYKFMLKIEITLIIFNYKIEITLIIKIV